MNTPKFQLKIIKDLKDKGLAESTINNYIRNLELVNDGKKFTNLSFLNDIDKIKEKLSKFKKTTIRNYYASIVAILSLMKSKATLTKKYEKLLEYQQIQVDRSSTEIAETQKDNWPTIDEVKKIDETLSKKDLSIYDNILNYLVFSLYTKTQPRRNKDYLNMYIVKNIKNISNDYNYFSIDDKVFVFNDYKTKKKYGKQIINIPDELYDILIKYIQVYPLTKETEINKPIPLFWGKSINYITRILNKIFGKNVGSTILRHVFLTDKYKGGQINDIEESIKDANAMAHSIRAQQLTYVKNI